jgi:hypothetical protein
LVYVFNPPKTSNVTYKYNLDLTLKFDPAAAPKPNFYYDAAVRGMVNEEIKIANYPQDHDPNPKLHSQAVRRGDAIVVTFSDLDPRGQTVSGGQPRKSVLA